MRSRAAVLVVSALALGACAAPSSFDGLTGGVKLDDAVGAPRPLSPISISMVATSRPRLKWKLEGSLTGAIVEMSRTRDFPPGATKRFEASGSELVVPEDLEAGIWFWRLGGAAGSARGTTRSVVWEVLVRGPARFGSSDAPNGSLNDVNGDGIPDLVTVGDDRGDPGSKELYTFPAELHGTADGDLHLVNEDRAVGFSTSTTGTPMAGVALAGGSDLDGDGIPDMLLSTTDVWGSYVSPITVSVPGSTTGLAFERTADLVVPLPPGLVATVGAAGDVDGDGYGDFIVGADAVAMITKGSAHGSYAIAAVFENRDFPPALQARAVLAGFDANGDGIGDVAVAQPKVDVSAWRTGTSDTSATALTGGAARLATAFGKQAPEAAGDDTMDMEVPAGPDLRRAVLVGSALRRASDRPHVFAATKAPADGATARTIATGDFNGDGLADVATAILEASATRVCVSFGDREKMLVDGGCIDALAGDASAVDSLTAGDLEGDGQDELVVAGGGKASAVHFEGGSFRVDVVATIARGAVLTTIWPGRPGPARWAVGDGSAVTVYEGVTARQTIGRPPYIARGWGRAMR